ncbi:MAG: DUF302 domain-containing protein [Epsilonproteobacteria bacterium]|nr:DUF302 domain-containing protein [Campylobacterota bacterium]
MKYIVETVKSVKEAVADLSEAIKKNGYGVLGVYDMKETIEKKGVAFGPECQLIELCNPHIAKQVLEGDMSISMALPCRISVYRDGDTTKIGTLKPTLLLAALSNVKKIQSSAKEVEQAIIKIIDDAK